MGFQNTVNKRLPVVFTGMWRQTFWMAIVSMGSILWKKCLAVFTKAKLIYYIYIFFFLYIHTHTYIYPVTYQFHRTINMYVHPKVCTITFTTVTYSYCKEPKCLLIGAWKNSIFIMIQLNITAEWKINNCHM